MRSGLLLVGIMCIHVMHMVLGIPAAEGIEQILVVAFQATEGS